MSHETIIGLALITGITLIVCTGFVAMAWDGKQKRDAIERVHQRSLEAAKEMQWKVEQEEGQGDE